ncbi:DUF4397 domain-containing protein [Chondromyces apiculatus]|nr:DUF4397 domain-containing protein [Chondromyces apiculatus]
MAKRGHRWLVVSLMLGLPGIVNVGCGVEMSVTDNYEGVPPRSDGDGGAAGVGGAGGAGGAPAAPRSEFRIAHLSPKGPLFDACLLRGDERIGPLLEGLGVTEGINYAQVSRYIAVDPGVYTFRVVNVGATDCEKGFIGAADVDGVVLDADRRLTIAALGEMDASLSVQKFRMTAFADETTVSSGMTGVRLMHAVPDVTRLDVGEEMGTSFVPLATELPFGEAVTSGSGAGFVETEPRSGVTLSVRTSGASEDLLTVPDLGFGAGQLSSVFVIGNIDDTPRPLALLVCADLAAPVGGLTSCIVPGSL